MNKSALRSIATKARKELIDKVKAKAMKIGITEGKIKKVDVQSSDAVFIDGNQLSSEEKMQRGKLVKKIEQVGYSQVIEEVAYTWFNRFTALRFMEANGYLPSNVRVLSSSNPDDPIPDLIKEAMSLDFEIDKEWVYEKKINNENDKLFQYLIIKQCNDLYDYLPFMFEKISDYTEILFPEGLLTKESFLTDMRDQEALPESDWANVEIIGWLYQFYISDEKNRVYKKKKRHKKNEIPFVTQLFTPNWIVRYMVENSLGKLWLGKNADNNDLRNQWTYYVDGIEELEKNSSKEPIDIENLKCFDPAMGSGHILVYMFDVLYQIYKQNGYMERDIPRLIIENNLYGLDIDERAYQLASFSVVMRALNYNNRFLRSIKKNKLKLNLHVIEETNTFNQEDIDFLVGGRQEHYDDVVELINHFKDAKIYGSLIKNIEINYDWLQKRYEEILNSPPNTLEEVEMKEKVETILPKLINQSHVLFDQYHVIVTNPPYIGSGKMNESLYEFLKCNYPESKGDTCTAFMEIKDSLVSGGLLGMINQHSWMFTSSYVGLRKKILSECKIDSMLHLGPRAFEEINGEVVQSTTFILKATEKNNLEGSYFRLVDFKDPKEKKQKAVQLLEDVDSNLRYKASKNDFMKVIGTPISYWASEKVLDNFSVDKIEDFADPCTGMQTGNNKEFTRYWYEVYIENTNIAKKSNDSKWIKYNEGGSKRKWYGNHLSVVNWCNNGEEIKNHKSSVVRNERFYFKQGITWKRIGTSEMGLRYLPEGFIFDQAGDSLFTKDNENLEYILGYFNSKVGRTFGEILAPTMNLTAGNIKHFPLIITDEEQIKNDIKQMVSQNIILAKEDWDSSEISWDFKKHPIIELKSNNEKMRDVWQVWQDNVEERFNLVKNNEEQINKYFIDIFQLNDELSSEIFNEEITLCRNLDGSDINSFMSYAVGCILGRYSLVKDGLVYAGGEFIENNYKTRVLDSDNVLPILSEAYFEDDIVARFINFVREVFGANSLEENLEFIAELLGKKKNESNKETIRRYFLNDFFKYHNQTYKKKPIYWVFTSGKQKAFNCLIYMHRYDSTTLGRIRTDYLNELQTRMDAEKDSLLNIINGVYTSKEIAQAKKELQALDKKIEELKEYDEVLHHMADQQIEIDLDDGVEVNYDKFKDLLAKK